MLYLNLDTENHVAVIGNLTLTSVVFESVFTATRISPSANLTLTSVVFESNEASAIDMCVKI